MNEEDGQIIQGLQMVTFAKQPAIYGTHQQGDCVSGGDSKKHMISFS